MGGCIRRLQDQREGKDAKKYSFLIHTESNKTSHAWQEDVVNAIYEQLSEAIKQNDPICDALFSEAYLGFVKSLELEGLHLPKVREVVELAKIALTEEWLMITKVNSEKQIEELTTELNSGITDHVQLSEIAIKIKDLKENVDKMTMRWLELTDLKENS